MARKVNTFIHGKHQYKVTTACVVAQLISGSETYVYRNGLLPANTQPSQIEHFVSLGLVRKLEAVTA